MHRIISKQHVTQLCRVTPVGAIAPFMESNYRRSVLNAVEPKARVRDSPCRVRGTAAYPIDVYGAPVRSPCAVGFWRNVKRRHAHLPAPALCCLFGQTRSPNPMRAWTCRARSVAALARRGEGHVLGCPAKQQYQSPVWPPASSHSCAHAWRHRWARPLDSGQCPRRWSIS